MKKTLVAIAALMLSAAAYAQGSINFANRVSGVFDAAVDVAGQPAATGAGTIANMVAQLFLVNGTSLTAVGNPIAFRGTSGQLARYFDGGEVQIPGTTAGGSATLRVRAWSNAGGATFATSNAKGESADFAQALGGGQLPPENLVNLKAFSVTVVPEPTTIALGLLGGVALLAARRRK